MQADDEPGPVLQIPLLPALPDPKPADDEPRRVFQVPPAPPFAQPRDDDEPLQRLQFLFADGRWTPSVDALVAGSGNFTAMQNLRFGERCLEGVPGYSKINTTALTTYLKIRSGIQLRSQFSGCSRVLAQAYNSALTASQVLENAGAVPAQADFSATALHTDGAGAGLGRFSQWPNNHIAYCNGVETKIYGGTEIPCAAFFTSTAAITGAALTNPKDYTEEMQDGLSSALHNAAIVGGGNDSHTVLLLHFDGASGAAISDSSASAHGAATKTGTADLVTTTAKYGTGSGSIPAYADAISYATHADWNPASNAFAIDMQVEISQAHVDAHLPYNTELTFTEGGASPDTVTAPAAWSSYGFSDGDTIYCHDTVGRLNKGFFKLVSGTSTATATISSNDDVYDETATYKYVGLAKMLTSRHQAAGNYWYYAVMFADGTQFLIWYDSTTGSTPQLASLAAISGLEIAGNDFNHFYVAQTAAGSLAYGCNGRCLGPVIGFIPDITASLVFGNNYRTTTETLDSKGLFFDEIRVSKGASRYPFTYGDSYMPSISMYGTAGRYGVVGFTRPVKAINFYVASGNAEASALTFMEWNGQSWPELTVSSSGTTDGGCALAQTGTEEFGSTVSTSKPKYLESRVLYWYQFHLSAGEATIYRVTGNAPFQDVRDCWDGSALVMPSVLVYDATNSAYKDFTLYAAEASETTVMSLDGLATTEHVLFGSMVPLMGFNIGMVSDASKVNDNAAVMTVAYCNGEAIASWSPVSGMTDGTTNGTKSLRQPGTVSFTPIAAGQEFKVAINGGVPMHYYKLTFSAALSADVEVYSVSGIPAPQPIKPYKFPFMFLGRPMLCGYLAGNEGNRVDYGLTYSTDCWNGPDSSRGVESAPIYFGGSEALTAACEVFNRLGSSIYSFAIFTKEYETYILNGYDAATYRIYPISTTYGCPAPLTMDTWQIGVSADRQSVLSVAMWLSHDGPVIFDSAGLQVIPGLECYFDRRDSRCINHAAIENARGWFGDDGDYNLQFPSGSGQTANNVWVVLNMKAMKWYAVVPSATSPYLGAAFPVFDTDGKRYLYGARDNGYMMRLHNPTTPTWDGSASVQSLTLADMTPSGSVWDVTELRRLKLFGISATEDVDASITHYADGGTSGTALTAVALNGAARYFKETQAFSLKAWSHKLTISATIATEAKGMRLLGMGLEYRIDREDY